MEYINPDKMMTMLAQVTLPHWMALLVVLSASYLLVFLIRSKATLLRDVSLAMVFASSFVYFYEYSHWINGKSAPSPDVYAKLITNIPGIDALPSALALGTPTAATGHNKISSNKVSPPQKKLDLQGDSEKNQLVANW